MVRAAGAFGCAALAFATPGSPHYHLHYHFGAVLAVFVVVGSFITTYTATYGHFWQGSW